MPQLREVKSERVVRGLQRTLDERAKERHYCK